LPPLVFPPLHRLASRPGPRNKTFSLLGAGVDVVVFLAVALLPSVVHGGVAGVQLASGLFGTSNTPTFGVNAFIALGILAAVSVVGALFVALGAVGGASIAVLTRTNLLCRAHAPTIQEKQ
jgi:hypothetical protein